MQRLAALGMTFREGPATARAALLAVDRRDDAPSAELLEKGYVDGVLRIETCSRVEWIVSSPRARWAVELLESSLVRRAGLPATVRPRRSFGAGAALHLIRVSLGLDSLVEGEAAVGRQLARAFRRARDEGHTDRTLHLLWKRMERARHDARGGGLLRSGFGIQTLVRDTLVEASVRTGTVPIFGRGDIAKAVQRALQAGTWSEAPTYGRSDLDAFFEAAARAPALVVCSGAPDAWLALPARSDGPLVVDVGFPAQLADAPGWRTVGLDALLCRPGCQLDEMSRGALDELASEAVAGLAEEIGRSASHDALAALDRERRDFLHEELPQLLAGLPPRQAARIRAGVGAFTHRILRRAGRAP